MHAGWASSAHGDSDDANGGDTDRDADAELSLEVAGQCWASCVCPARTQLPDQLALCTRCFNHGHTDLVRSVHIGEHVIISGSYDSTVKVSRGLES
jgi:hypothetical protein